MQTDLFNPALAHAPLVPRPHQTEAVAAVYEHLRTRDDNPCVVLPTGGGKTLVIATIGRDAVKQWGGRVVVLAHVKELLEQSAAKLRQLCGGVSVGVYSAGLNRRESRAPIVVAGIQSIYKRACDLDPFDLAVVDEAHLIAPDGDGMYRQFLADSKIVNPNLRIVGMTATPFRMKSGPICTPDGFLNSICYSVGVRELIVGGYLSPLVTKNGQARVDTERLTVRGGEFVASEVETLFDVPELVTAAVAEIVDYTAARKSCLIFCAGVKHAEHVAAAFAARGLTCGIVTGETPDGERAAILDRFRRGELPYLANVNVLTTGFDAPNVDCVALLRATLSPGLYYQMVGRGFRLCDGKADCLVLDFGGNVLRHGPVDRIEIVETKKRQPGGDGPAKECPKCHAVVASGFAICPDCGHEFPPPERTQHEATASGAGILSGQVTLQECHVAQVLYSVHTKRDAPPDHPRTLRVDYVIEGNLHDWPKSEWICVEHDPSNGGRQRAENWWRERSPDPFPRDAHHAVDIADGGGLAEPSTITVRSIAGEKFERIVGYTLGAKPEPIETGRPAHSGDWWPNETYSDEDIPF